ncbi:replication factor C large subunit [Nanoarchaeota archaeon]
MTILNEKYRPKKVSEIVGQLTGLQQIISFLRGKKKSAIIYGPIGCGKTSAVHAISKQSGYELLELNAGDFRDKQKIREVIGGAVAQKSLFFKKKLIFIDEIDNLSRKDYGGLAEINNILRTTTYPVIMCANKPFDKKLLTIRKKSDMIEFKKLDIKDAVSILRNICTQENISASDTALKQIALLSEGDIRAAINDLQASGNVVNKVAVSKRDQEVNIFSALRTIFKSNSFAVLNALDNVDMDLDEAILWIDENLPLEYNKREIFTAYQALSRADIFKRRIHRHQHWHYLVYINALVTAGVTFAKQTYKLNSVAYRRATRILKLWMAQGAKKKMIAKKFSEEMHLSTKKFFREIPYIKIICQDEEIKENLREKLDLNKDEMDFILGRNKVRYM